MHSPKKINAETDYFIKDISVQIVQTKDNNFMELIQLQQYISIIRMCWKRVGNIRK